MAAQPVFDRVLRLSLGGGSIGRYERGAILGVNVIEPTAPEQFGMSALGKNQPGLVEIDATATRVFLPDQRRAGVGERTESALAG